MTMDSTVIDKVFRDDEGKIVIAQPPNLPITLGLVSILLKTVFPTGTLNVFFHLLAFGSLFTWAWLELFQGVNYFRRGLGIISLIGLFVVELL